MTEKTKTAWKAIGGIVTIIFVAIGVCGCGPADETAQGEAQTMQGETQTIFFGGYTWRVLEEQDGRALLLSEDILEQRAYNDTYTDVTWEHCTLRKYLNGTFYESFNEGDRSRIALTRNDNPDNTWATYYGEHFNTPGGNTTDDYIFLLSVPEVLKCFPGLKLYKASDGEEWWYEADERLAAKFNDIGYWWWLRSPGDSQDLVAYVNSGGYVLLYGNYVDLAGGGVRPALWLNL